MNVSAASANHWIGLDCAVFYVPSKTV